MEETETGKTGAAPTVATRTTHALSGRLGIVVDGKTIAVIGFDAGGAALEPPEGETRASVTITSMDDFRRIARGELNLVVASLRGCLSLRGDMSFGVRALRALQGGMRVQGLSERKTEGG
jgi:hypothetical protein